MIALKKIKKDIFKDVTRGGPWAPSLVKQNLNRKKFMKSFTASGRNIWHGWFNWDVRRMYIRVNTNKQHISLTTIAKSVSAPRADVQTNLKSPKNPKSLTNSKSSSDSSSCAHKHSYTGGGRRAAAATVTYLLAWVCHSAKQTLTVVNLLN